MPNVKIGIDVAELTEQLKCLEPLALENLLSSLECDAAKPPFDVVIADDASATSAGLADILIVRLRLLLGADASLTSA